MRRTTMHRASLAPSRASRAPSRATQAPNRAIWALALVCLLVLGACKSQPLTTQGTNIGPCDTLHGRLVNGRCGQSFTIEGVESSLLCLELKADCEDISAPQVALTGPDGQAIAVAAETTSQRGATLTRVSDVVLMRSGTYRVTVTPTNDDDVYYTFDYALKFPGVRNHRVNLTACNNEVFTLSAPRGGLVTVQIRPHREHDTQFQVNAVEDPWGGRALDPASRPQGAKPPEVRHQADGSYFLHFIAPIAGRYTVYASAKPGHEGPAFIDTCVKPPRCPPRQVMHPNAQPRGYGVPAPVAPAPCAPAPCSYVAPAGR